MEDQQKHVSLIDWDVADDAIELNPNLIHQDHFNTGGVRPNDRRQQVPLKPASAQAMGSSTNENLNPNTKATNKHRNCVKTLTTKLDEKHEELPTASPSEHAKVRKAAAIKLTTEMIATIETHRKDLSRAIKEHVHYETQANQVNESPSLQNDPAAQLKEHQERARELTEAFELAEQHHQQAVLQKEEAMQLMIERKWRLQTHLSSLYSPKRRSTSQVLKENDLLELRIEMRKERVAAVGRHLQKYGYEYHNEVAKAAASVGISDYVPPPINFKF